MNQEYVILGWKFWKLWGKKIWLWRNHPMGSLWTRMAVFVSDRVFCTSKQSFTARFKKTEIMPVGIDTDFFKRDETVIKKTNSILFLGRISPIKKPEILIEALGLLKKENVDFTATIVGDPLPKDDAFYLDLKSRVSLLGLDNNVIFLPSVSPEKTPKIYNSHELFINLTPSGSFDKTIFEAISCGSILITSNKSLFELKEVDSYLICDEGDIIDLVKSIKYFLNLSAENKKGLEFKLGVYASKHNLKETVFGIIKGL
jgi:glycosyltransferase involved in cell wall biosynthesis